MKKICTFLIILFANTALAGTPTINGIFSPTEGWGPEIATGDGNIGWADANAKKLYSTHDNNFIYFAAECSAQSWQQFMFILNTKSGGGDGDSWGRQIGFNHTNPPDFLFRGNISGSNYAEYHVWNGTSWTGLGTNINTAGAEVKGVFSVNNPFDGFIEIRVPRSLIGAAVIGDVQFVICGDNNNHGSFDAIPNDVNSSAWNPPSSFTGLSQYVSNVLLPVSLSFFKGEINNQTASLSWLSTTENNFSHYEIEASKDALSFSKIATVLGKGNANNYSITTFITQNTWYRLKMVDKDGSFNYSKTILLKPNGKKSAIELLSNPVKDQIKISINYNKITNYTADIFTIDGKRVATKNYQHAGGVTTFNMNAPTQKGIYFVRFTNDGAIVEVLKLLVE